MTWMEAIDYWHWWVLAVILIILEVFSPAAFFLWMAISAAIVGVVVLLAPALDWVYQVLVFAIFSVASIAVWHLFLKRHPTGTDQPLLNRRGEQYVGRVFTLNEAIVNGHGKIQVDDSTWKISGSDCGAGTRVKVTGVDGVVLEVEVQSETT